MGQADTAAGPAGVPSAGPALPATGLAAPAALAQSAPQQVEVVGVTPLPGTDVRPMAFLCSLKVDADDLAAAGTGSSNRIERALLLDTPPSAALGELTDKGSINQRRVLALRADAVQALYAEPADARVLRAARMPLTDRARA